MSSCYSNLYFQEQNFHSPHVSKILYSSNRQPMLAGSLLPVSVCENTPLQCKDNYLSELVNFTCTAK